MVVPGFNDSHIHLLNYAYSLTKLHLEGLNSVEEIVEAGIRYVKEKKIPAGQWVIGCGWNHYFFPEPRFLNRHDLDRISPPSIRFYLPASASTRWQSIRRPWRCWESEKHDGSGRREIVRDERRASGNPSGDSPLPGL